MLLLTLLCLALDVGHLGDPPAAPEAADATPTNLLERVVVIGASASDGFGLANELDVQADLSLFLDAAWTTPRTPTVSHATNRFFLDPLEVGTAQRDAVLESKPTLVVAVDYLFWFGYGTQRSEAVRLENLEQGLQLLDSIDAPMLVGDFPDMRPALKGEGPFGQPMLSPSMIPEPQTIARLNARLDEWAKERPRVIRVSMADFVTKLQSGSALELRGMSWSPEQSAGLLQKDLLHPTVEGTAALALLALDALERHREDVAPEAIRWDVAEVVKGVRAATEPERAERREKEAARKERLRKLEERKREREAEKEKEESSGGDDRDESRGQDRREAA